MSNDATMSADLSATTGSAASRQFNEGDALPRDLEAVRDRNGVVWTRQRHDDGTWIGEQFSRPGSFGYITWAALLRTDDPHPLGPVVKCEPTPRAHYVGSRAHNYVDLMVLPVDTVVWDERMRRVHVKAAGSGATWWETTGLHGQCWPTYPARVLHLGGASR